MAKAKLTKKERQKRSQRRRRQISGLVFICLALIGVGTIITLGIRYIGSMFDDTEVRQDYQKLIAPLVAMDPVPFDSFEDANGDILLEAAIWAALDYEDTTKYERNEAGSLLLPSVEVERYYSAMYGPSHTVEHHSFTDLDIEFIYVAETSSYVIPITSQGGSYTPVVESISGTGSERILRVAYMQGSTSAAEVVIDAGAQTVVKYMEYVMKRDSGGYYIDGVREPAEPAAQPAA